MHDAFDAGEHGSIGVIEEGEPVVDIFPLGHLVVDVAQYRGTAVALVADNPAQRLLHRHTVRFHAVARLQHDTINHGVLERMVNLPHHRIVGNQRTYPQHKRRHPFPVAIVPQQQGDGLAAVEDLSHLLAVLERHATHDVLVGNGGIFNGLDQDVTEVAVELHPQFFDFLVALVGIGDAQVFADHATPIMQHIGNDHKQHVAKQVMQPQRQQR